MTFENLSISEEKVLAVLLLFIFSISIRFFLSLLKQRWANNFSHTATIVTLPLITYVITSVITGNIALSLGMVGALSIIRFRNPVRSPFELVVYFSCVTMGIAASVSLFWLVFFFFALILFVGSLILIDKVVVKYIKKKSIFLESFSEAIEMSTLEIKSDEKIDILENSEYLISETFQDENHLYILSSENFDTLLTIKKNLEKLPKIKYINIKK